MCNFICLRRSLILLVLALGAAGASSQVQANPQGQAGPRPALPALPEMWTKLQARLDSAKAKPGDVMRAQLSQAWVYGTCGMQGGSTLEGRVLEVSPWTDAAPKSEISVSFRADCSGGAKKPLILIAVYFPVDDSKSQMDLYKSMPAGIGPGASGRQSTNLNSLPSPDSGNYVQMPLAKLGEVKGVRHLSLGVAKGAKGSTVVSSTEKRLRLEAGTRLVLLPEPEAH